MITCEHNVNLVIKQAGTLVEQRPALTIAMGKHRMADMPTKRCRCCLQDLPHSEFYARATNRDGLYSYCRTCNTNKAREARERRPEIAAAKREYDRARFARLGDQYRARALAHYEANKEYRKERIREWGKKNPERRKATTQSYKHRRRTVERAGMSGPALEKWKKAQVKVCYWCGSKCDGSFHVDHYVPLSKGGRHEESNLVIACRDCNYRKHAKDPLVFAREVGRLL